MKIANGVINEKAERLALLRDKKKILEIEEKELKEFFEAIGGAETGSYLVVVSPSSRETVSLAEIKPVFGERLNAFIHVAEFNLVKVTAKR